MMTNCFWLRGSRKVSLANGRLIGSEFIHPYQACFAHSISFRYSIALWSTWTSALRRLVTSCHPDYIAHFPHGFAVSVVPCCSGPLAVSRSAASDLKIHDLLSCMLCSLDNYQKFLPLYFPILCLVSLRSNLGSW